MSEAETYQPTSTKRKRRTKEEIQRLERELYELLERIRPATVRQVFYRMVVAELIGKTESEYHNTVSRLLVRMRRRGDLPFHWISDNTRWMRKPNSYSSMEQALKDTAQAYRRSLWDEQNVYVEIWTEKDALAGVLMEETAPWDVPLMVSRGFSSITYLYEAAANIQEIGKRAYLYYFGDHDPSGRHIDRSMERRLHEFAPDAEIHFERVAIKEEQIAAWNLPTRPTKRKSKTGRANTHAKNFVGDSVEVDAIEPAQLRQMVSDCITRHIDQEQLERTRLVEKAELETFQAIAAKCGDLTKAGRKAEAIITAQSQKLPHGGKTEFLSKLAKLHGCYADKLPPEEMHEALGKLSKMVWDWDVKTYGQIRQKELESEGE
jgi:hypothetical protein